MCILWISMWICGYLIYIKRNCLALHTRDAMYTYLCSDQRLYEYGKRHGSLQLHMKIYSFSTIL